MSYMCNSNSPQIPTGIPVRNNNEQTKGIQRNSSPSNRPVKTKNRRELRKEIKGVYLVMSSGTGTARAANDDDFHTRTTTRTVKQGNFDRIGTHRLDRTALSCFLRIPFWVSQLPQC